VVLVLALRANAAEQAILFAGVIKARKTGQLALVEGLLRAGGVLEFLTKYVSR